MSDNLREKVARAIAETREGSWPADTYAMQQQHYLTMADAALAVMATASVQVKPLEWATITPDFYERAERFGMMYGVTRARDGKGWVADASPRWSSDNETAKFDARDLAYDWCENHNEARVLAAIEPAPASVQDAARVVLAETEAIKDDDLRPWLRALAEGKA